MNRRQFVATTGLATACLPSSLRAREIEATDIGKRRELFIDRQLIQKLRGSANQRLHHPVPQNIAIEHDEDWEGTGSGYHSIFHDGEKYRMYYKAWHIAVSQGRVNTGRHPLFCCYAESDDGITWRKPNLGIYEFKGSKNNNITMITSTLNGLKVDPGHPAVFMDENPNARSDARFKAIFRSSGKRGLIPFKSPDGLHWTPISDDVILNGLGAFDSQNLAFWDPTLKKYRAYWRTFSGGGITETAWKPKGDRSIRTAISDDMVAWQNVSDLTYVDSPSEQLYTNQVKHYHRAPHILIGFPNRYFDRGPSVSMSSLPDAAQREMRASASKRYGYALSETLLMSSRDGTHFKRWNEAFLRPGIERPGTWHYGAQYMGWHAVETKSALPGAPDELSLYATEAYWHGKGSALRRYTLRLDGFVSVNADMKGGELITKPVVFQGAELELNFASSAAGGIRVEVQNADGKPVKGFSMAESEIYFGDTIARKIRWKNGADLKKLSGTPIRLRFELKDADLYSYRFY